MPGRSLRIGVCAAALQLLALAVLAAPAPEPVLPGEPPQVEHFQGIPYISGGVGEEELRALRAISSQFNVRLGFYNAANSEALSEVTVVVLDVEGQRRLRVVTRGPLLYMTLPPGRYTVYANYLGETQSYGFSTQRGAVEHTFRIPVNELEDDWLLCQPNCPERR